MVDGLPFSFLTMLPDAISLCPYLLVRCRAWGELRLLFASFYPVRGQVWQLCMEHLLQAISDSKPFMLSVHFPCDATGESVADRGFSSHLIWEPPFRLSPCGQFLVFLPLLTSFRSTFTSAVSGPVVVRNTMIFHIFSFFPALNGSAVQLRFVLKNLAG